MCDCEVVFNSCGCVVAVVFVGGRDFDASVPMFIVGNSVDAFSLCSFASDSIDASGEFPMSPFILTVAELCAPFVSADAIVFDRLSEVEVIAGSGSVVSRLGSS